MDSTFIAVNTFVYIHTFCTWFPKMLSASNLSLSYAEKILLNHVSFSLLTGERVALVGYNGEGKSSLFGLITGTQKPDEGKIEMPPHTRIGHLAQEPHFDPNFSVIETVKLGLSELIQKIADFEQAGRDENSDLLSSLMNKIESMGGFDVDHRIEKILMRLGVKARQQKVGTLSGGEQRRVDLARVLLSNPDIFLLDEPTNHLDMDSIGFLAATLKRSHAPLLFISHDRSFVDEVATRIIELDKGSLYSHTPPFEEYVANRLVREESDERTHHRREQLLKNELNWLRAGVKARTTKQNARINRTLELKDDVAARKTALQARVIKIESGPGKRLAKTILECNDVAFAYGERVLFEHLNLNLIGGARIGIIGPNGCGKTTFLSLISGEQSATSGTITRGPHTHVAVFEQNRKSLNPESPLKEIVHPDGDFIFMGERKIHVAAYLEKFLFNPADLNRKVHTLSGGEQNRLLLAKLFTTGANCLIFDEPTNDLDLTSLAVLEEAIISHKGVALIVSHDRAFLDRVCTNILAFVPGENKAEITLYEGNYSYWAEHHQNKKEPDPESIAPVISTPVKTVKRKRSYKEEQEYQQLTQKIEVAERELVASQAILADGAIYRDNPEKAADLARLLGEQERLIEAYYKRWQELEDAGS